MSYGPAAELGPQPRVLEPYPMATPPPMSGVNVNPFWSTQARSHPVEGGLEPEVMHQGGVRRSPNYVGEGTQGGRESLCQGDQEGHWWSRVIILRVGARRWPRAWAAVGWSDGTGRRREWG